MGKYSLETYRDRFRTIRIERDDRGILIATLHLEGRPLRWGVRPHRDLTEFWEAVALDRETRAVILTGTGESFIDRMDNGDPAFITPRNLEPLAREGRRLLVQHLEVPVPVIAAVNGPVTVHAEQALLADIVLATPDACFADLAHFPSGIVPGDGIQAVFEMAFGFNRARYLIYTGAKVTAEEALACGAIGEVVPRESLMTRAVELATKIIEQPEVMIRSTRMLLNHELQQRLLAATTTGSFAEGFAAMDYWPTEFATNRK